MTNDDFSELLFGVFFIIKDEGKRVSNLTLLDYVSRWAKVS